MTQPDADRTRPHIAPTAPATVAHYRVLERIGAGGMGEVYLAQDTKLDRRVALKFLPAPLGDDPDLRVRFLREARTAARLDHPNIVTIHEVGEHEGRPYIAMQYVDGRPLSEVGGGEALSLPRILRLVAGICDGLAKAHAAGVTHRDVKPANILVGTDRRPVLLDFGLATLRGGDKLTKAGSTVGTVAYMSPEQARGLPVDPRSDLFSCGVVLYELIAGRSPFRRDHEAATLNAILTEEPEPLARFKSDVPPELQHVVSKCLARRADERYQTAVDLAADLRRIERALAAGAGEPARPAPSSPSAAPGSTPPSSGPRPGPGSGSAARAGAGTSGASPASGTSSPRSVAVLPFANMSADPENEYFADGLTDELLNVLARNPGLKVTGRTSSFAFKGKREDLREIGQKLGVGTLLEGSVRKAGSRVRITAQLVDAADGFHLWSETYDRVLDDVFAVQDDIARSVAEALNVKLLGKEGKREGNAEGYALLLRANQSALQSTNSSLAVAVDLYRKAIDLEPENGRAWAGLARSFATQAAFGHADAQETYREAKETARRALALDDESADAHEVMGWILAAFEFRFADSVAEFRRAHELAPNHPRALTGLAIMEGLFGRFDEALSFANRATEIDPLDPDAHLQMGRIELWADRPREAEAAIRRALQLSPGMTSANLLLSWTLLFQGRAEEALDAASREESAGYRSCGQAIVHHTTGRKAESDRALAELLGCGDQWAFQFACAHAWRGERDEAFAWLEKALALRDAGIPLTKVSPLLRSLHDDPRWSRLLERIGLAD